MIRNKILTKLNELENNLNHFNQILPDSKEKYLNSKRDQLAIERLLQISIESIIDICLLLIKHFKLGPPSNEDHIFDLLNGKIENINRLKEMKSFRNLIVHRYGEIDNNIVYNITNEYLDDFSDFIENIKAILN